MRVLIIGDDVLSYNINTDTTYFMLLNLFDMQINDIYMCLPNKLVQDKHSVNAYVRKITVSHGVDKIYSTNNWCTLDKEELVSLDSFTDIFVRNDPPVDMEYLYITHMLSSINTSVRVHNPAIALREFNEKLNILKFPEYITDTIVTRDKQAILDFVEKHERCVIKPLDLMGGRGIFVLDKHDVNMPFIAQMSSNDYTKTIMLQKFIPEIVKGDKRIFIVNGELIPYTLCRIPKDGGFKGNIVSGARGEVQELSTRDIVIGKSIASWAVENEINFIGFDVIVDYLTEVNLTSPTGSHQIYKATGINVSKLWLDKVLGV